MTESIAANPDSDSYVEDEIRSYLTLESRKSFFLYAGAGSGKTRSLVNAIRHILSNYSRELMLRGQSIAVITYTNAAAEEVARRLEYNKLVSVSTIHSFAWALIRPFQSDIKSEVRKRLEESIKKLESKKPSKPGSKTEETRLYNIERSRKRLESLNSISQFTYSPSGTNGRQNALDHAEVIALAASMLKAYPTLAKILTTKYPYLFVDESQDTNSDFLSSLLEAESQNRASFCLGLFGDTMQRIYNDGMQGLEGALGEDWAKPEKQMNHRSAQRIVQLANSIRAETDQRSQYARDDRPSGTVRLFLASNSSNANDVETYVLRSMARTTGDEGWLLSPANSQAGVKKLILEHHMAANRLGFRKFFEALGELESNRTSVLEGSHPEVKIFTHYILPLIEAARQNNEYAVMSILRERSPLLAPETLKNKSVDGQKLSSHLAQLRSSLGKLLALYDDSGSHVPRLYEIAEVIDKSGIFELPDRIVRAINYITDNGDKSEDNSQPWVRILKCSYDEALNYSRYIEGHTDYATQQGVKGLEFPRVMAIISDDEARGFLFSYEKLFGVKLPTQTDRKNELEGKETSLDRTRRLFYVTCTRAVESLAVLAFTANPGEVKTYVSQKGWFDDSEIEVVNLSMTPQ